MLWCASAAGTSVGVGVGDGVRRRGEQGQGLLQPVHGRLVLPLLVEP